MEAGTGSGSEIHGRRSVSATGPLKDALQDLEEGMRITEAFDSSIKFSENMKKRQFWSTEKPNRVEHLGLTCIPCDPEAPILPRGDWSKLERAIKILKTIPGAQKNREICLGAYVKPLWNWASPIVDPAPEKFIGMIFRATIRARCSWWCCSNSKLHCFIFLGKTE